MMMPHITVSWMLGASCFVSVLKPGFGCTVHSSSCSWPSTSQYWNMKDLLLSAPSSRRLSVIASHWQSKGNWCTSWSIRSVALYRICTARCPVSEFTTSGAELLSRTWDCTELVMASSGTGSFAFLPLGRPMASSSSHSRKTLNLHSKVAVTRSTFRTSQMRKATETTWGASSPACISPSVSSSQGRGPPPEDMELTALSRPLPSLPEMRRSSSTALALEPLFLDSLVPTMASSIAQARSSRRLILLACMAQAAFQRSQRPMSAAST
mmetsp:Transcript_60766/g.177536  ORF Transcript_60766/g.177536 Transcript_60766/m.177536 type:complete len:267 (+) Transcript_60766:422-1222(+)